MFNIKKLSKEEQKDFYRMLDTIQDNEEKIAELKAQNEDYKATLERYFDEDGYKDSGVTIFWKKPTEVSSIDTKRIEAEVTKRSGCFSYKFKKEEE